jgi:hypothetical protein
VVLAPRSSKIEFPKNSILERSGEQLLSYFELLPDNVDLQVKMDLFIKDYYLIESGEYENNLEYISI